MTVIYDVWHVRPIDDENDTGKHIGFFSSEESAKAAIELLKTKPGFADYPDDFEIYDTRLNLTGWAYGF
ncbi:hypothetical protein GCM10011611_31080 [Aliidongia dinghuensis]|uniref:Uncharacterized protein n=1 Tax=Aliidongia dinghuensis TaxID=1867774 RepID=A0A8J2YUG7_9PROT|nr:RNA-binding protein [Aliidongia dinghuensis]GGF22809.1 hypothetical protein GCM10011611_31080 [Aliidongia dinghuensis]